MKAYLYNCIKRRESTMPPAAPKDMPNGQKFYRAWIERDCRLKQDVSIVNPIFVISDKKNIFPQSPEETNVYTFNYIYVPKLGRGYWIADWTYTPGAWEAACSVDVLGSFPLPVRQMYITRASDEFDTKIRDAAPLITSETSAGTYSWAWPFAGTVSEGRFVVGIIGKSGGQFGAVTYYVMTSAQILQLMYSLMGDTGYLDISTSEISNGLQRGLINPIQYIASCMWVPWVPDVTSTVQSIDCGWWTFNVSAGIMSTPLKQIAFTTKTFDMHPQINTIGQWLMQAPYSSVRIFCPPWGLIDVPINTFDIDAFVRAGKKPAVGIQCFADAISGQATLDLSVMGYHNGTYVTRGQFAYMTTQLGITIPLAQATQNAYTAAVSMGSNVSSAINDSASGGRAITGSPAIDRFIQQTSGRIAGKIAEIAGNVKEYVTAGAAAAAQCIGANTPLVNVVSAAGSYLNVGRSWAMSSIFSLVKPVDNEHIGRPLCKKDYLQNHSGFVKVMNPEYTATQTATPPTAAEISMYEQALADGIFIEGWL
nr:MAG TPA: hypothetical protein [Caudoviricetes sp.]